MEKMKKILLWSIVCVASLVTGCLITNSVFGYRITESVAGRFALSVISIVVMKMMPHVITAIYYKLFPSEK
jgi:hypothetical protein